MACNLTGAKQSWKWNKLKYNRKRSSSFDYYLTATRTQQSISSSAIFTISNFGDPSCLFDSSRWKLFVACNKINKKTKKKNC